MIAPVLYLLATAAAEVVTIIVSPLAGVVCHILLLLTLVSHASFASQHPNHKLYLALSLPPLIRILSLSMPLGTIPVLFWYAIIAVPLIAASFACIRLLGYSRWDVGLTPGRLPVQVVIGLLGLPLGIVEYLILKPTPMVDSLSISVIWLPVLILLVGTGFTEELVFRGILQKAALDGMRGWGLCYVSIIFAVLHLGYYSLVELVFVLVVGYLFAWLVAKSGSILGATLAHGLVNSTLFLFAPLLAASIVSLESVKVPDVIFISLAPAPVREAVLQPDTLNQGEETQATVERPLFETIEPWPTPTPSPRQR